MGSPFKGAEDYLAATGTIDSFTGHPLSATIVLVLRLGVDLLVSLQGLHDHALKMSAWRPESQPRAAKVT